MERSTEDNPLQIRSPYKDPIRGGIVSLVRPALNRLLRLRTINKIYRNSVSNPSDQPFSARVLQECGIEIDISDDALRQIPASGPLIIVANHPYGGVEGLALDALVRRVRPDVKSISNYLLHALPPMREDFLPIDPFGGSKSATHNLAPLRIAMRWPRDGHALIIFPAGEVSHSTRQNFHVSDPPWDPGMARLIRKSGASVLPIYVRGHNRTRFQIAGLLHPRLRTLLLPREFLNQRDSRLQLEIGHLMSPDQFDRFPTDHDLISYLRIRTYSLRGRKEDKGKSRSELRRAKKRIRSQQAVAKPGNPELLCREIEGLPNEYHYVSSNKFDVYCAPAHAIPETIYEIGRQRELVFRTTNAGTGKALDLDEFDKSFHHLFLWNNEQRELVGAYRLGLTDEILAKQGLSGLYCSTLFRIKRRLIDQLLPAIELGRSFIRPEYQKTHSALMLLWKGIGQFVCKQPKYNRLFGTVTITNDYHSISKQILIAFLESTQFVPPIDNIFEPRHPVHLPPIRDWNSKEASVIIQDLADVDDLIREVEEDRMSVPVLIRQYSKLNAKLLGFNVDPDFGDVVDGLMYVDLAQSDPRFLTYFMGRKNAAAFLEYHNHSQEENAPTTKSTE